MLLNFTWSRCVDGYSILSPGSNKRARGARLLGRSLDDDIAEHMDDYIAPNTNRFVSYRPFEDEPQLFLRLASIDNLGDSIKKFAVSYGDLNATTASATKLTEWYEAVFLMKFLVTSWQRKDTDLLCDAFNKRLGLDKICISLVKQGNENLALNLRPNTLMSALYLQFAMAVTDSSRLSRCRWCSAWFTYGSGTGRRRSSQYCSDRCRKAAHRHRQEEKGG